MSALGALRPAANVPCKTLARLCTSDPPSGASLVFRVVHLLCKHLAGIREVWRAAASAALPHPPPPLPAPWHPSVAASEEFFLLLNLLFRLAINSCRVEWLEGGSSTSMGNPGRAGAYAFFHRLMFFSSLL